MAAAKKTAPKTVKKPPTKTPAADKKDMVYGRFDPAKPEDRKVMEYLKEQCGKYGQARAEIVTKMIREAVAAGWDYAAALARASDAS